MSRCSNGKAQVAKPGLLDIFKTIDLGERKFCASGTP